jgi:hypothetical protein
MPAAWVVMLKTNSFQGGLESGSRENGVYRGSDAIDTQMMVSWLPLPFAWKSPDLVGDRSDTSEPGDGPSQQVYNVSRWLAARIRPIAFELEQLTNCFLCYLQPNKLSSKERGTQGGDILQLPGRNARPPGGIPGDSGGFQGTEAFELSCHTQPRQSDRPPAGELQHRTSFSLCIPLVALRVSTTSCDSRTMRW